MPRDEILLSTHFDNSLLQRRCDIALWFAMYDETLKRVARHRRSRADKLAALAKVAHERPGWGEEARDYNRSIDIRSDTATHFSIGLVTGDYPDEFVSVDFRLREHRGVWVSYSGVWSREKDAAPLSFPMRPSDANRTAVVAVSEAMSELHKYIIPIPDPSAYMDDGDVAGGADDVQSNIDLMLQDTLKEEHRRSMAEERSRQREMNASRPKSGKGHSVLRGTFADLGKKAGGAGTKR